MGADPDGRGWKAQWAGSSRKRHGGRVFRRWSLWRNGCRRTSQRTARYPPALMNQWWTAFQRVRRLGYGFGTKLSIATTSKGGFVAGMRTLLLSAGDCLQLPTRGNPHDGRPPLSASARNLLRLYGGHRVENVKPFISGPGAVSREPSQDSGDGTARWRR